MTDQQTAFARDTDEIAPKAHPTDAELRALWEAVETIASKGDFDAYRQDDTWVATLIFSDTVVRADTPAAALIALAARIQGGN